jgi:hypothetical protein
MQVVEVAQQFEYDLIACPPRVQMQIEEGKVAEGDTYENAEFEAYDADSDCGCAAAESGDDAGSEAGGEDEQDFAVSASCAVPSALTLGTRGEDEVGTGDADVAVVESSCAEAASEAPQAGKTAKRRRTKSKTSRAAPEGDRLEELSRPKPAAPEPEKDSFQPEKRAPKKPQSVKPSVLLRIRPQNLEEARERFFESGFTEAPRFEYAYPVEVVEKLFAENSNICFEMLADAKRIMQKVHDEHGGPESFMQKLYGEGKMTAEQMRDTIAAYLKDHNIEDKTEIRIVDGMLSAANVVKPGQEGAKYIVNIASGPIAENLVPGICDHEVGTHLLRMMNDEHQAWHGRRDQYKLANPWTTEEGFATLNTYITMPSKLLYSQAFRYWAVCRGAQLGFVELFREIQEHVTDPKRCWAMCCRIKRGMVDTSAPGAFYMDQAYFKGAVEILRHLDEVDFGRLYGGQIALQDLDKVYFILRKEVVRLPRFLRTVENLKTYKTHCRRLIRENEIQISDERVCRQVFIRTAKEFFKPKAKQSSSMFRVTLSLDGNTDASPGKRDANRTLDLGRLEDLARPKQSATAQSDTEALEGRSNALTKLLDQGRLTELALPRRQDRNAESREDSSASRQAGEQKVSRVLNLKYIEDLAKPKQRDTAADVVVERGEPLDRARLVELARPRSRSNQSTCTPLDGADADVADDNGADADHDATTSGKKGRSRRDRSQRRHGMENDSQDGEVPPPPAPFREPDMARLSLLAAPKRCQETSEEPCACAPSKDRRRKRSKRSRHRLLALVQERREAGEEDAEDVEDRSDEPEGKEDGRMDDDSDIGAVPQAYPPDPASTSFDQSSAEGQRVTKAVLDGSSTGMPSLVAENLKRSSWLRAGSVPPKLAPDPPPAVSAAPAPAVSMLAPAPALATGIASLVRSQPRAVARARSVGAETLSNSAGGGSMPAAVRSRLPAGLPRGAARLGASCAVTAAGRHMSGEWKAVPIQTLQLSL